MNQTVSLGIALLASGSGFRFGANKLLRSLKGKPVTEYIMDAIPAPMRYNACVITCWPEVAALASEKGFRVLENPNHAEGISAGIRLATKYFSDAEGIMFSVCDQPLLKSSTIMKLCQIWLENPSSICRVSSGGHPGNPCIIPCKYYPELLRLSGDCGGGAIIRSHPEDVITVEVSDEELWDCDTPEILKHMEELL